MTSEEWEEYARVRCYEGAKSMLIDLYYRRSNGLGTLAHIFNVPMREIRAKLKSYNLPIREQEKGGDSVNDRD